MENTIVNIKEKFGIATDGTIMFRGLADFVTLDDIRDIIMTIERLENNRAETLSFMYIGSGAFKDVYSYKENLAVKRSEKYSMRDYNDYYACYGEEDVYFEFDMGLRLNNHDIVAKTYALVETEEYYYIVTERIMGVELSKLDGDMVKSGEIDSFIDKAYDIHLEGIYLNDLHDGNIMIDLKGNLKIVDIGLFANTNKALTKEHFSKTLDCEYKLNHSREMSKDIELFKKSLFNKSGLIADDITIEKYFDHATKENEDKKDLIHLFADFISNEEYLSVGNDEANLSYHESGSHSNVYFFDFRDEKYVFKVQRHNIEEQKDIMNRLRTIDLYVENIVYYHDRTNNALYTLQKHVGEEINEFSIFDVGDNNSIKRAVFTNGLCNFENDLMKTVKMGLIPRDLHCGNLSIDEKTFEIECFDVSYFYRSNITDYENVTFNTENILKMGDIHHWYDKWVQRLLSNKGGNKSEEGIAK